MFSTLQDLLHRGGPVLWLLAAMSVITVALLIERAGYWLTINSNASKARVAKYAKLLREGDQKSVKILAQDDATPYGKLAMRLTEERITQALAMDAIESQRSSLERFMPLISTLITAAPMLGLLGTVTGLISTFHFLSDQMTGADPRSVGVGLAEALLNTAAGLSIAIVAIFPYNAYRAQIDRSLSRMESLVASAEAGQNQNEK